MRNILIFGGTFDPPHWGHIKVLQKIQEEFEFTKIHIIPCKEPTDKPKAKANTKHRIAMLNKILHLIPNAILDCCEMERDTPSYTIETIKNLARKTQDNLILCIGMDAFLNFETWNEYKQILEYCKLLVVARHNYIIDKLPLHNQIIKNKENFLNSDNGAIFIFNAGLHNIASSKIRKLLQQKQDVDGLLPSSILEYIKEQRLY